MKSDFDLIVHKLPAAQEVKLYIVGDLHVGAIEANIKGWERFTERVLNDRNAYLCIIGDMMNNATKSSVSNVFEETMRPREQKRYLMNALKCLTERILCGVPGNHEARSGKDADDDPLYDVFCKLDLEDVYRPNIAFMRLCIGDRTNGKAPNRAVQSYVGAVMHGAGGGIYTGAAVNRNERTMNVFEGVDFFAVGHTHKGTITKPSKIVVDPHHNTIQQKTVTVVSACSWMVYGGYSVRKMLLPSSAQDPESPQTLVLSGKHSDRYIRTIW